MTYARIFIIVLIIPIIAGCGKPKEYRLGEAAYNDQKYEEAIASYQLFIENYPTDPLVDLAQDKIGVSYYKLGIIYESKGDENTALQMYKSAMELDPTNDLLKDKIVSVYVKKGQLYLNSGYYEAAVQYLQQAVPYKTENSSLANFVADAYFLQGHAHLKARQSVSAAAHIKKALKTTNDTTKLDKYEQVLVSEANDYLRKEQYFPALLYFSLLTDVYNNQEYANLDAYVKTQLMPTIDHYPAASHIPSILEQLSLELTDQGYVGGNIENASAAGFLTDLTVNVRIFDHSTNESYFEAIGINLLGGYIGFISETETPSTRTIMPLEPKGVRNFVVKTNHIMSPTDIVQIDIVDYGFLMEQVFGD